MQMILRARPGRALFVGAGVAITLVMLRAAPPAAHAGTQDWTLEMELRDLVLPDTIARATLDVSFPEVLGGSLTITHSGLDVCGPDTVVIRGVISSTLVFLAEDPNPTNVLCQSLLVVGKQGANNVWRGFILYEYDTPNPQRNNSLLVIKAATPLECQPGADRDNDRLEDCIETGTGVFNGPEDTGTDPNNPDTDGDSIRDGDEVLGTVAGLDLPALGANPLQKNILIEYDWIDDGNECNFHSHRPTQGVLDRVEAAFASAPVENPDGSTGITTIQDRGQGGAFSGGNLVQDTDGVLTGGVSGAEFRNHKATNFDPAREGYFHYTLLPHRYNTSSSSSGQAEQPGDDLIVSLYCSITDKNVANTVMHEVGHNLNLRHGGFENCNYKPNYNSVMNYAFHFPGVDNDCTPRGDGVLDYSWGNRITLDENALEENDGTCGPGNPWDWNGNTFIESSISHDLNSPNDSCVGAYQVLSDFDDWSALLYTGVQDAALQQRGLQDVITCENTPPEARLLGSE
jgi:hypothetical protein